MKQKLTYIARIILFGCFLLAVDICGQASDVTHIAFTSRRTGNSDIYIMDIEGKNIRNLTDQPAWDFAPTFSPNGRWMAYVADRDIYLMNSRTKERHRLTEGRSILTGLQTVNPLSLSPSLISTKRIPAAKRFNNSQTRGVMQSIVVAGW